MRRIGLLGVCVVAALALSAVAAAAAFAEAPEVGRCVKSTPKAGGYTSATCTKTDTEDNDGTYEWKPGAEKGHFTGTGGIGTLETVGKVGVQCKTETSEGHYAGPKTVGGVAVLFKECASAGFKCQSAEAGEGEIKTNTLAGELVWEHKLLKKIALRLFPESGELLAQFTCGPSRVEVRGSVLVNVLAGKMIKSVTLKYTSTKGKQKPEFYETAGGEKVRSILETDATGLTKGWEQSGQTITNVNVGEEALKVNWAV